MQLQSCFTLLFFVCCFSHFAMHRRAVVISFSFASEFILICLYRSFFYHSQWAYSWFMYSFFFFCFVFFWNLFFAWMFTIFGLKKNLHSTKVNITIGYCNLLAVAEITTNKKKPREIKMQTEWSKEMQKRNTETTRYTT